MTANDNRNDQSYNALFVEKLSVGTYQFPTTDGTNGQFLTTNGNGNISWSSSTSDNLKGLWGKIVSSQTNNLSVGDHIKIDTVSLDSAANITLDTSTPYTTTTGAASIGRITLAGGKTYLLDFSLVQFNATTLVVSWYNATTNTYIDGPSSGNYPGCKAIIAPGSSTLVEVRIVNSLLATNVSKCFLEVLQLN